MISTILIKCIPYIVPVVLGALGWVAKKIWNVIAAKITNETVATAIETLLLKAGTVVEGLEQTIRPELAKATADGKLTKEEAAAIAKIALEDLFAIAAPEVKTLKEGGMDEAAVEKLASSALEQAVYRLPKPQKANVMTYGDKIEAMRLPQWQRADLSAAE